MVLKLAGLVKRGAVWIYGRAVPPKLRAVVGASEVKDGAYPPPRCSASTVEAPQNSHHDDRDNDPAKPLTPDVGSSVLAALDAFFARVRERAR